LAGADAFRRLGRGRAAAEEACQTENSKYKNGATHQSDRFHGSAHAADLIVSE
jgi:hypothetical protein